MIDPKDMPGPTTKELVVSTLSVAGFLAAVVVVSFLAGFLVGSK
jgi:hypothetical protein